MTLPTSEMSFQCPNCPKSFPSKPKLVAHHYNVHRAKEHQCRICPKKFNRSSVLQQHLIIHSNQPAVSFFCEICQKGFKYKSNLSAHKKIHREDSKIHSCSYCEFKSIYTSSLKCHLRKHTKEKPYKCNDCGRGFPVKLALSHHVRIHLGIHPFTCDECKKKFRTRNSLLAHVVRMHLKNVKYLSCQTCSKTFSTRSGLRNHKRSIHEKLKPFECGICKRQFGVKAHMTTHECMALKVPSTDKPFQCTQCGKAVRTERGLGFHLKSCNYLEKKKYICDICDKNFRSQWAMAQHKGAVHEKLRPFQCEICPKSFTSAGDCRRHVNGVHENLKPYRCPYCPKCYRSSDGMKKHLKVIHHKFKSLQCDKCTKYFQSEALLLSHGVCVPPKADEL